MSEKRILLVEDESAIAEVLEYDPAKEPYEVDIEHRGDKGRSRDKGGTGLGPAIVKHVARLHGGRVEVESHLGEGSSFRVHLPIRTR